MSMSMLCSALGYGIRDTGYGIRDTDVCNGSLWPCAFAAGRQAGVSVPGWNWERRTGVGKGGGPFGHGQYDRASGCASVSPTRSLLAYLGIPMFRYRTYRVLFYMIWELGNGDFGYSVAPSKDWVGLLRVRKFRGGEETRGRV